jgi:hypothetical protein
LPDEKELPKCPFQSRVQEKTPPARPKVLVFQRESCRENFRVIYNDTIVLTNKAGKIFEMIIAPCLRLTIENKHP